jgi:hypothetical protein
MSEAPSIIVDDESDKLHIDSFETSDPDVVGYFEELSDEEQPARLTTALRIGAIALRSTETQQQVDFVERRFARLEDDFQQTMTEMVGEDGELPMAVREHFGEDGRVPAHIEDHFGEDGIVVREIEDLVGENGELHRTLDQYFGEDGRIPRHVEEHFGEDGTVVERIEELVEEDGDLDRLLDQHLGDDGRLLREVFDPNESGTPLYELRESIEKDFEDLRKELALADQEEEIKQRTPEKGFDFEDQVEDILTESTKHTGDLLNKTAEEPGELDGVKTGDFVLDLNGFSSSIVVEAKDRSYSEPAVRDEMAEAMENRNADYGLFVSRRRDHLPQKMDWFKEFGKNFLVVSLGDGEDARLEDEILRIGYKWARMRVLQEHVEVGDELDPDALKSHVTTVENELDRFRNVRRRCTNIEDAVDGIRDELDEIEDNAEEALDNVSAELMQATT